jgi:hypothetical protein
MVSTGSIDLSPANFAMLLHNRYPAHFGDLGGHPAPNREKCRTNPIWPSTGGLVWSAATATVGGFGTGLLEVAEAIQRLVEAALKAGIVIALDSVQAGLIGKPA